MTDLRNRIAELEPDRRALLLRKLRDLKGRGTEDSRAESEPVPVERNRQLPLSYAQERMWILQRMDESGIAYNTPAAYRLEGPLDRTALERALYEIISRHESLRTTAGTREDIPFQTIRERDLPQVLEVNLGGLSEQDRERELESLLQREIARPFDLANECPIRIALFILSPESHVLLVNMHHFVSDEPGWTIFEQELSALYNAFASIRPSPLPPLALQYADIAVWERERLEGETLTKKLEYWKAHLTSSAGRLPGPVELPVDYPRQAIQSHAGRTHRFSLPAALRDEIQRVGQERGATLFMTLYGAFTVLLARYTNQDELIVGTPSANRSHHAARPLIGFFTNMLAVRTDLSDNPDFDSLLKRVRDVFLESLPHQDAPFEKVVEAVAPERTSSREPLVQVVFDFNGGSGRSLDLLDIAVQEVPLELNVAKYDLAFSVTSTPDGLRGEVEYSTALFEPSTVERMTANYRVLLESICADPHRRVWDLPILTPREEHRILSEWNDTDAPFPDEACVHEAFEARAARHPEAVAVVAGGVTLTYGGLNSRAERLAARLRAMGAGPDTIAAVCLPRSAGLIVGILGILKAGAAYLPIDPANPAERLRFIVRDARANFVITEEGMADRFETADAPGVAVVCLDRPEAETEAPVRNVARRGESRQLAYVIYTSGSTGEPKGVAISHGALANLVHWHHRAFLTGPEDRATSVSNLGFDAAVWEIWPYLTAGAQIHLVEPPVLESAESLRDWLVARRITVTFLPTPLAEQILTLPWPPGTQLRLLLTGGDRLRQYPPPGLPFQTINNYGPTENTVVATSGRVEDRGRPNPPIGRPVDNVQVYILDRTGRPTPVGVPGELHLGGKSLAVGYLHREELTREKFVPNPFGPGRLYRTGDLARYLPGGDIEFVGRIDNQVKIRGFRIELGEIESALRQSPAVSDACVTVQGTESDPQLVAFVVAREREPAAGELLLHLASRLPQYMTPSRIVFTGALPLTANGKIDRAALAALAGEAGQLDPSRPRTATERAVAEIWAELLKCPSIGLRDNFFEIGGHSLLAMRTVSMIHQRLGLTLTQYALFERPTVEELAAYLDILAVARAVGNAQEQRGPALETVEW